MHRSRNRPIREREKSDAQVVAGQKRYVAGRRAAAAVWGHRDTQVDRRTMSRGYCARGQSCRGSSEIYVDPLIHKAVCVHRSEAGS